MPGRCPGRVAAGAMPDVSIGKVLRIEFPGMQLQTGVAAPL